MRSNANRYKMVKKSQVQPSVADTEFDNKMFRPGENAVPTSLELSEQSSYQDPSGEQVMLPTVMVARYRKLSQARSILARKKNSLSAAAVLESEIADKRATTNWSKMNPRKRMSTKKMNSGISARDTSGVSDSAIFHEQLNSNIKGIDEHSDESASADDVALVAYFAKLAKSTSILDELDLQFIESLLQRGADVNSTDQYGQTLMHEAARAWHKDVVKFLLHHGAAINQEDMYGRTPLHVACAVNYGDMVAYLLKRGADMHLVTYEERQTPIHYAAKFDSIEALQVVIAAGADIEVQDYKNRTPLQLAAELDRTTTTKYLIEVGALLGVRDSSGIPAMTFIIEKMSPVAKDALEKLHVVDGPNREQEFHLNLLESEHTACDSPARSPMAVLVKQNHINLLLLPIMQRLLQVKWNRFGRKRHLMELALYFLYITLWSVIGFLIPEHDHLDDDTVAGIEYKYTYSGYRTWWLLLLEVIQVIITIYYIVMEIREMLGMFRDNKVYKEWRTAELKRDLVFTHPCWPDEREYLNHELEEIDSAKESYLTDMWNVFDWLCYILSIMTYISRIYVTVTLREPNQYHRKLFSLTLIFIWLRLMKLVRVFSALGPFIVMIGQIVDDTIKFAFLFFEVFIPFVFGFWIIFGGHENAEKITALGENPEDWETFDKLLYSVWAIAYGGDYNFNALRVFDSVTASILVGVYVALSAILLLNLFIALMSNSFQTVYDNAKGNALMQKASVLLAYEDARGKKNNQKFIKFIEGNCAPLVEYYDEDDNEAGAQLEKMTLQIKAVVDDIQDTVQWHFKKNPKKLSQRPADQQTNDNADVIEHIDIIAAECQKNCELINEKVMQSTAATNEKIDKLTNLVQCLLDENRLPNRTAAPTTTD